MFSAFTSVDRTILHDEVAQICPLDKLEELVHRCMNERTVVEFVQSRIAPWSICRDVMEKFGECRVAQMKHLEDNVDTVSRTMMFREAFEEHREARAKGIPTARIDQKISRIREDFRLILEAKKLAEAPPKPQPPQKEEKPNPKAAHLELARKIYEEDREINDKLVRAWRAKRSGTRQEWAQYNSKDTTGWI